MEKKSKQSIRNEPMKLNTQTNKSNTKHKTNIKHNRNTKAQQEPTKQQKVHKQKMEITAERNTPNELNVQTSKQRHTEAK